LDLSTVWKLREVPYSWFVTKTQISEDQLRALLAAVTMDGSALLSAKSAYKAFAFLSTPVEAAEFPPVEKPEIALS
jgi:hypothetical protein